MEKTNRHNNMEMLIGGGEMGKLIAEKDWANTSLGPPASWPQNLFFTLNIILHSKFPHILFWGADLVCFYNDAFVSNLGQNGTHPVLFGRPAKEGWAEAWDIIKPCLDKAMNNGESTFLEDELVPFYRDGNVAKGYWTFSYSPVFDECGKPVGVFVTCSEDNKKIKSHEALAESKLELEFVIEAAELGTWDFNPNTYKFSSNQRLKNWFGLEAEEQIELTHAVDVILESDRSRVAAAIQQAMDFSYGGKYDIQYTVVHPVTKKEKIFHAKGRAWFNDYKKPYRFNGTLEDVTQQVLTSKKVKQNEQRFQSAVEAVNGILWTNNARGEMEGEQLGWAQLTGQAYDEYQGYGWSNAIHPDDMQPTIDAWNESVKEEKTFHFEHRVRVKNGSWRNFSIRAIPIFDNDGNLAEWVGVHIDITDQRLIEIKIRESEEHFRKLIDTVPSIIWITDPDGSCSYLSRQWYDYTGQVQEEKQIAGLFASIHPHDMEGVANSFFTSNNEQKPFLYGYRLKKKTGEYRWVINNGLPKYGAGGNYEGMIGTIADVHDEKISSEKIKESEERYHNLISSSPFAIGVLKGKDLLITQANNPIIEIWGKGWDIMGKPYFVALPELAEQGYKAVFENVYKTGESFNAIETPVQIRQNGKMLLKYYNFLLYAQKNIHGVIDGVGIIATEVTSQALLNAQIKESEKRFRALADSMPQQVWTADTEGNLNYFNQAVFDYSGLTIEQIEKDGWIQIVHPDDREMNIKNWMTSIETGNDFIFEHRFRKYTGEFRWQLSRATAQRDEHGKIQMWVGSSTDIEEQKSFSNQLNDEVQNRTKELLAVNESLKKSEERYHLMVEEVQDYAILYLNRKGIVENWNAGAEKIKGYKAAEIIGKSFSNFYTAEDKNNGLPQMLLDTAATTGRARQEGWRVKKDGSRFWASVVITAVHNQKNEVIGFSKVTHDLSEKKEADDKLRKNALELEQKNEDLRKINKELESFAYISSHDLQEPLRKIQTFTSWLIEKEYKNLSEKGRDRFQRMERAAGRMQKLIDDLLAYSRTASMDRKYEDTDLNQIVEEVRSDLAEELQQKNATIKVDALCHAQVIPFQFRQLLQNLVTNSLKFAKPGHDPLITITSRIADGEELKNNMLAANTTYCHISISDNGIGFDQRYSEKIFELFQRLHGRTEYHGTGIGLSIVKRIVENHNGFIAANSEINKGATFNIYLPVDPMKK